MWTSRARARFALCAAAALLAGCGKDTSLSIAVNFASTALADSTVRIELNLVPSCSGVTPGAAPTAFDEQWQLERDGDPPNPVHIGAGSHALYARAFSSDCEVIGAVCKPFEIKAGSSKTVTLTLAEVDPAAECEGEEVCDDGTCIDPNAPVDGGMDALIGPPSCGNDELDEGEVDVDCGGDCKRCADGDVCIEDTDCASWWCSTAVNAECLDSSDCDDLTDPAFCDGFEAPADMDAWSDPSTVDRECGTTAPKKGQGCGYSHTATDGDEEVVDGLFLSTIATGSVHARAFFYVPASVTTTYFRLLNLYNGEVEGDSQHDSVDLVVVDDELRVGTTHGITATLDADLATVISRDSWMCVHLYFTVGQAQSIHVDIKKMDGSYLSNTAAMDTSSRGGYSHVRAGVVSSQDDPVSLYIDEVAVSPKSLPCP